MAETLEAALDRIFSTGGATGRPPVTSTSNPPGVAPPERSGSPQTRNRLDPALLEEARTHYENAMKAQREGNWALYGEEIRRLGELLRGPAK
jgi:uncharacterized membrane protein (UPF0182 family)